ncbi:hypothetical protein [Bradyrhizobium sp. ORS 111]|uniref:hypothetical protein n=1 Tax=Bradyrhizobium sp. ORS 111 TaxID=1685958 RepID=UPI00388E68A7
MTPSVPEVRRRLAAILAADVVGYTRLMEAHEENTHARLMKLRAEILDPGVTRQNGRIVKNTGDGFLATFDRRVQGRTPARGSLRPLRMRAEDDDGGIAKVAYE